MRWIVLSENRPANLHAVLESARRFSKALKPDILLLTSEQIDAMIVLQQRLNVHLNLVSDFREDLLHLVSYPRTDGELEPITMISTDRMLFQSKPQFDKAWLILQRHDVAGVSMSAPVNKPGCPQMGEWFSGRVAYRDWIWTSQDRDNGPWGTPFHFGTVYRTQDLVSAMETTAWHTAIELYLALDNCPSFTRRNRMACLGEPSMVEFPYCNDVYRYLQGEVLDVDALTADPTELSWKPYEEE